MPDPAPQATPGQAPADMRPASMLRPVDFSLDDDETELRRVPNIATRLAAERDRLAAENASLRGQLLRAEEQCRRHVNEADAGRDAARAELARAIREQQECAGERDAARELLALAADALWEMAKTALTVKPNLDQPYPDAPEWTPWTRWMEPRARRAHDLKVKIRQHLKDATPADREEPR